MGSTAGSGIIIGHERSRSVGIAQKKKQLEAHTLFVQHKTKFGFEKSNRVPQLLQTPTENDDYVKYTPVSQHVV